MREFADIAKVLGDKSRVRMLLALRGRELCVCQLVELLGLAPSTVSNHLSALRHVGLVDCEKKGRWVYYRRAAGGTSAPVREALHWVDASLAGDEKVKTDAVRLKKILRISPEELCQQSGQR